MVQFLNFKPIVDKMNTYIILIFTFFLNFSFFASNIAQNQPLLISDKLIEELESKPLEKSPAHQGETFSLQCKNESILTLKVLDDNHTPSLFINMRDDDQVIIPINTTQTYSMVKNNKKEIKTVTALERYVLCRIIEIRPTIQQNTQSPTTENQKTNLLTLKETTANDSFDFSLNRSSNTPSPTAEYSQTNQTNVFSVSSGIMDRSMTLEKFCKTRVPFK